MLYGYIDHGHITAIECGPTVPEDAVSFPDEFQGVVGQAQEEFNADWTLKPLSERVKAGFINLPPEYKLVGEEVLPKTFKELVADGIVEVDKRHTLEGEGSYIREKHLLELMRDGIEAIPNGYKLEIDESIPMIGLKLSPMTRIEMVSAGFLSKEVAFSLDLADCEVARKAAYVDESDPIFFDLQRGRATREEWETKVEEIKARYPKPTDIY